VEESVNWPHGAESFLRWVSELVKNPPPLPPTCMSKMYYFVHKTLSQYLEPHQSSLHLTPYFFNMF
jgi:hypothetical protein